MKVPKININKVPKDFEVFTAKVEKSIKRNQKLEVKTFSADLYKFTPAFERTPESDVLIKKANQFAERLVGLGNNDFAGIVYSFLLKVVKNPKIIEMFAVKQLAIAKRTNDPIHIMARTADIKKIYKEYSPNSPEHLKWLREEARSIRRVINHYEHSTNNFKTISREAQPKEFYEQFLGFSLVDIGKILKKQSPKEALTVLEEAKGLFEKLNIENQLEFTNTLIKETEAIIKKE